MLLAQYNKSQIFALISFSALLAGLLALVLFSNTSYAQQLPNYSPPQYNNADNNTIYVTGTAGTAVKPDKVIVSLGIITANKTSDAALASNSIVMNKVIDALKAVGLKDNETRTLSFRISPIHKDMQSSDTSTTAIAGFTVSNSIQIETTNINNISKLIDTAISTGANTVDSIDFILSDKKLQETETNLINQAIENAKMKADTAASAAGVKVIGLKSLKINDIGAIQALQGSIPRATASPLPTVGGSNNQLTPIIAGKDYITINAEVGFTVS